MAKSAGTHEPLGWIDRLRLNAAVKHLRSPFHAVRVAAHNEIKAILHRQRGVRGRLRAWARDAARAAVRKVTPRRVHEALGVQARAPRAPKRAAPAPATPWRGYTPLTTRPLTKADLKARDQAMRRGERVQPQARAGGQPASQPARQHDILRAAGLIRPPGAEGYGESLAMREARIDTERQEGRPFRQPPARAKPEHNGRAPRDSGKSPVPDRPVPQRERLATASAGKVWDPPLPSATVNRDRAFRRGPLRGLRRDR